MHNHPSVVKATPFILVLCLVLGAPCLAASDAFVADRATPLKLAKPGKEPGAPVRFTGQAQISGRFQVGWTVVNGEPRRLRAVFFPDGTSTRLLPYAAGSRPVEELLLSNSDQAVSILLEPSTVRGLLAKEQLEAKGEATVTIGDYQTVVECDHRWYMARLVSASRNANVVLSTHDNRGVGC